MTEKTKGQKVKATAKPGKHFYVGKEKISEGKSAFVTEKAHKRLVKNGLAE